MLKHAVLGTHLSYLSMTAVLQRERETDRQTNRELYIGLTPTH